MLDFRFLIGTILVGIALAMTALRMFGPVEPLLADRPDLETAAVPRGLLVPVIAKVPNTPARKQASQKASPPIAPVPIIPKPPASIQNAPVPVPVQMQTPQIVSTPKAPVAAISEQAAVPLPSPKPETPEVTGSIDPTDPSADPAAPKPKRAPVAVRKRETPETPQFGELNLFRLFFPQAAGQKQPQGANRAPTFPQPFTQ